MPALPPRPAAQRGRSGGEPVHPAPSLKKEPDRANAGHLHQVPAVSRDLVSHVGHLEMKEHGRRVHAGAELRVAYLPEIRSAYRTQRAAD